MGPLEKYKAKQVLMEKLAVSLSTLRNIFGKTVRPRLIRHAHSSQGSLGGPAAVIPKMTMERFKGSTLGAFPEEQLPELLRTSNKALKEQSRNLSGTKGGAVYAKGDTGRSFGSGWKSKDWMTRGVTDPFRGMTPKTPAGREFLNRAFLSHEGGGKSSELGKHFGAIRFGSHLSTRPFLHDLNIAATATGPGASGVKSALKQFRHSELSALSRFVPGIERLNLGTQRISRSAQRRIQEIYERNLLKWHKGLKEYSANPGRKEWSPPSMPEPTIPMFRTKQQKADWG